MSYVELTLADRIKRLNKKIQLEHFISKEVERKVMLRVYHFTTRSPVPTVLHDVRAMVFQRIADKWEALEQLEKILDRSKVKEIRDAIEQCCEIVKAMMFISDKEG